MGGWLQVYNTKFVETREFFGFESLKNKETQSAIIVSDGDGKIAGIYLNKDLDDVEEILKLHPDLATLDF